jgi:hypothetical protein
MLAVRQNDERFNGLQCWSQFLNQRQKASVKKEVPVLRVVDDEFELCRKQTRIGGMQYRPYAGRAKKQLQVTVTVPRQCADAFSAAHAQGSQRTGNLPGTAVEFGIGASSIGPSGVRDITSEFGCALPACSISEETSNGWFCIKPSMLLFSAAKPRNSSVDRREGPFPESGRGLGHPLHSSRSSPKRFRAFT